MLVVVALGFILTSEKIELKIVFIALFGGTLILSILRLYLAKEVFVYTYEFQIKWNTPFIGKRGILIPFDKVEKVRFTRGGYRLDRSLRIYLKDKNQFKILLSDTDKNIADLLRFLYKHEVRAEIIQSDQEMELYIEGRIKEYPMKNEKTV